MAVRSAGAGTTSNPVAIQITEQEASLRYGLSVFWFRLKRCQGGGPEYRKIGNRVFYLVSELDRFFSERTVQNTSEYETRRPVEAIAKKQEEKAVKSQC